MERDIINQQSDALHKVIKANGELTDLIVEQREEIVTLKARLKKGRARETGVIVGLFCSKYSYRPTGFG